ncbi:MAG TPA: hypothetical protein PKC41_12120 [Chitinophagaceae bacterium]|nr:hypothetical protein [Chitinophagaceae bacterium]
MISINSVHKIDYVNIGLLILSCILAFLMPFELFLFAYGVLGPLHYLTEISWLHDKNYYSTDKRDVILLVVISLVLTVVTMKNYLGLADLDVEYKYVNRIIFIAFASSLFFAFIKNNLYKIIGVCIVILLSAISDRLVLIFSVFLPTLIHVFLFTWLFMFYGALKNRSKPGYITVALHMVIPFILFYAFPSTHFVAVTDYGKSAYKEFQMLNLTIISLLNNSRPGDGDMVQQIFNSQTGIAIMRFIAFPPQIIPYSFYYSINNCHKSTHFFPISAMLKTHLQRPAIDNSD